MAKNAFLTIVLCSVLFTFVNCVVFKQCSGGKNQVTAVSVAGDSTTQGQALLKKNTNVSLEVKFTAETVSKTSTSVCHGLIHNVPIPFALGNDNGCLGMTPTCPITKGTAYTYRTALFVKEMYPKIRLVIKWEEKADDNTDIFCILIPATIVD